MAAVTTVADAVRSILHGAGATVIKRKISFTADTDGSFTAATVSDVGGFLTNVYVDPGSTAPTNLCDLYVKMDGIDLLGGAGENIAVAADASITPKNTLGDAHYPGFAGDLVVSITGNSVNGATVDVYLIFTA